MRPKISVLIPTRNRAYTLWATIQTCLDQNYRDMELVICDNASNDGTEELAGRVDDKRVRYVRFDDAVSMSMNWERGLKLLTGSHVILIGADDALIPGSLESLALLVERTGYEAISWVRPNYNWPDIRIPGAENMLGVPGIGFRGRIVPLEPKVELQKVLASLTNASTLPALYNSIIDMRLIERIARESRGSVYFQSQIPDIYSGIVNSVFLGSYLYSQIPYSINGGSGGSNGVATFGTRGGNPIEKEFRTLNAESNLSFLECIPDIYTDATVIGESFLRARLNFPERTSCYTIDISLLFARVREWIDRYYSNGEAEHAYHLLEEARKKFEAQRERAAAADGPPDLFSRPVAPSPTGRRSLSRRILNAVASRLLRPIEFGGFSKKLSDNYKDIYQVASALSKGYRGFYSNIDLEIHRRVFPLSSLASYRKSVLGMKELATKHF